MSFRHELPAGTQLDGKYIIERVIGAGGFGITYAAHDIGLNTTVALKEYYPADFGTRDHTMSVRPKNDQDRDLFERLRQSFVREARTLAQFKHPSIVRVLSVFESHGTAYMVMEYEDGKSFKAWLQELGRLPSQEEMDKISSPLLDALDVLHQANFLHRDIAPDNIILRTNNTPVLLDFGAARRVMTEATSNMTGVIKQGYSPQEQYASDGKLQGPWTDIYALGATLYHAVTGAAPQEAMARMLDDNLVPAVQAAAGNYRHNFLAGIDAALKLRPKERPQSIPELKELLFGDGTKTTGEAWHRARTQVLPGSTPDTAPTRMNTATGAQTFTGPGARTAPPVNQPELHAPQATGSRSSTIGMALVGALVLTGAFGAYKLATKSSDSTVAVNTTVPGPGTKQPQTPPKDTTPVVKDTTPSGPGTQPERPGKPTETGPQTDNPFDRQRDTIIEEARKRAEQAERERIERERQAGGPKQGPSTVPGPQPDQRIGAGPRTPAEVRLDEIERNRIEQSKRNRADADFQEALKFANGTDGVTRDYSRARPLFERSANNGNPDAMNWVGWLYFHGRGVQVDYQKAREWYERAANAGQSTALNQMGWLHQNGLGVPQDFVRALEWYRRAAGAGSAVGMYNLAAALQHGRGTAQDYPLSLQWYELAAGQGDASSMSQVGWFYQNGLGVTVDYVRAREWYEKAANAGSSSGMNQLGWLLQNGLGTPRDYNKARDWYERAANAGNGSSMNQLGWMHANGLGVPKDFAKAREWYEKSANAGNATGMYNLASAYENGQGVPRDYGKAREWYERAAGTGDHAAMSQLGWIYQNGLGTPTDYARARDWYEKAAAGGNSTAMNQLGWLHQNALGVPQNYQLAREWYERAANAGNGSGMNQLGWMYANGLGVPKDLTQARAWYERSAAANKDSGIWNLALQLDAGTGGPANYARAAQLLLRGVRLNHEATLKELNADMRNWNSQTRVALKRELQRLGHYQGNVDDNWNDSARRALEVYRRSNG